MYLCVSARLFWALHLATIQSQTLWLCRWTLRKNTTSDYTCRTAGIKSKNLTYCARLNRRAMTLRQPAHAHLSFSKSPAFCKENKSRMKYACRRFYKNGKKSQRKSGAGRLSGQQHQRKSALTCSRAAFLSRSLAKWWMEKQRRRRSGERYRRWVPRPSGPRSPLCRCRSCRGWGTQKCRWHKGTWAVCRRRFRRTLHRSGPRSRCRRRTPSSLWCTCLWRAAWMLSQVNGLKRDFALERLPGSLSHC